MLLLTKQIWLEKKKSYFFKNYLDGIDLVIIIEIEENVRAEYSISTYPINSSSSTATRSIEGYFLLPTNGPYLSLRSLSSSLVSSFAWPAVIVYCLLFVVDISSDIDYNKVIDSFFVF